MSIGVAACSGVAWSLPATLLRPIWEQTHPGLDTSEPPVDDRLREDLARLAHRAYSEEGIPMFLACVNLVPAKTSHRPAKVSLAPLNTTLAATFQRNAEAFQRTHPNAQARDIAPIIEVLADRDFANSGTKENA